MKYFYFGKALETRMLAMPTTHALHPDLVHCLALVLMIAIYIYPFAFYMIWN